MTYTTRRTGRIRAKKTTYNGERYDSKFEAGVAHELEMRKRAGEIADYDRQFKVEMWAYRKDGSPAFKKSHKIDFRIHELDGTFTLVEAKGVETADYQDRRRWLENLWLPDNLDHKYEVIYQSKSKPKIR